MTIEIDPTAGFCFGVKRAISAVEEELENGCLGSLGEIVHNEEEQKRLQEKGLKTVLPEQLPQYQGKKVLIRAHGEPPETYRLASRLNIELIDATCPIVKGIQKKIRKSYEEGGIENCSILIFGKPSHPETIGLVGQTEGTARVIRSIKEITSVSMEKKIILFAQTTMNPAEYKDIVLALEQGFRAIGKNPDEWMKVHDTICRHVSGREKHVRKFAQSHDLILFVSGKNSSNGKFLFQCCLEENPASHMISDPGEIDPSWLMKVKSVGISGATSTPEWLIQEVKKKVSSINLTLT